MNGAQTPGSRASSGSTGSRGQSESIKKVAVTMTGQQALFMELDQNRPLAAIIQDICDKWTMPNAEECALQFSEPSRQTYITERNREDIQNGNVLQLTESPGQAAQIIITKLKNGSREERIDSLKSLAVKANDNTFALEFIHKTGLKLIIDYVIAGNKQFSGDPLTYLLRSFVCLMEHNVVSWDILEPEFTKQVAECVSGARAVSEGCIQPSLEILENIILHSSEKVKMAALSQYITPDKIIPYVQSKNADVQQSALALINAIFMKSPPDKKQTLAECFQSRPFRTCITNGVLGSSQHIGPEMAHQLYKLQRLMLNMYESRMNSRANPSDSLQAAQINKSIEDLRRIAFDFTDLADPNATSSRKSAVAKDYKKLGFHNQSSPLVDFEESPPGLLALDNMLYFAQCHKESYIKVVLENSGRANEQDCPFVQASIQLTKILCNHLKVGEAPYEDEHSYYPMFFLVDKPLEEFYSVCIQLLNRTWKEMRASKEDFPKVLSVVNEQVTRALDKNQMPKTFENFRTKLVHLAYPELKKIWEGERQKKDESKAQAKPILELREMIKPEILELIRKQRLLYLEGGTRFPKFDNRGGKVKNRYIYWRLSPNHKALHHGDCQESSEPTIEQLPNKVNILEIKELLTGRNCPHVKSSARKTLPELAFSISLEGSRPDEDMHFCFMAGSEQEYNMWVDGIEALLNNKMVSKQTKDDMETLLNMEIKLRLLETEGITIPKEPPPIPPLPDNYNFAYKIA